MPDTPAPDAPEFDDFEDGDGPDDGEALDQYAAELAAYVEATGTPVLEPGTAA